MNDNPSYLYATSGPTVANVLAQIAIDGQPTAGGATQARRPKVIESLLALGIPRADAVRVVDHAIDIGVVLARRAGSVLEIAR